MKYSKLQNVYLQQSGSFKEGYQMTKPTLLSELSILELEKQLDKKKGDYKIYSKQ